jgi:S1-C subfamily serine protease
MGSEKPVTHSGHIIASDNDPQGDPRIRFQASIEHGMSGGPIFTADGKVIGIMVQAQVEKVNGRPIQIDYGRPTVLIERVMREHIRVFNFHAVAPKPHETP